MEALTTNPGFSCLLLEIFSGLDLRSLLRSRIVCRQWKRYVDSERLLWTRLLSNYQEKILAQAPSPYEWLKVLLRVEKFASVAEIYVVIKGLHYNVKKACQLSPHAFMVEINDLALAQILVRVGRLDLEALLDDQRTRTIHLASMKDRFDLLIFILPLIAVKNPFDSHGNSPMQNSLRAGLVNQVQLFLQYVDEDFWSTSHGSRGPPILDAIMSKSVETVEIIRPHVDLDAPYGDMAAYPLHLAVFARDPLMFRYIYSTVANKSPQDSLGRSPLELAKQIRCESILDCIEE